MVTIVRDSTVYREEVCQERNISVASAKELIAKVGEKCSARNNATKFPSTSKMTSYRTELYIPVVREKRTFEMIQSDALKEVENLLQKRHLKFEQAWYEDMSRRMTEKRSQWEKEISHMREEFFQLKPLESGFDRNLAASLMDKYTFDQMKTVYERDQEGQLHFQIRFDVHEFCPEEIEVVNSDHRLQIKASQNVIKENSKSSRQFSRSLDLPRHVNVEKMKSCLTQDGVLIIDAPVLTDNNEILGLQHQQLLSTTSNSSGNSFENKDSFNKINQTHQIQNVAISESAASGPLIRTIDGRRQLYLEVKIGKEYSSEEVKVNAKGNRLCIYARHENRQDGHAAYREFQKEYEMPTGTDVVKIDVELKDGTLYVKAPMHQQEITTASTNMVQNAANYESFSKINKSEAAEVGMLGQQELENMDLKFKDFTLQGRIANQQEGITSVQSYSSTKTTSSSNNSSSTESHQSHDSYSITVMRS